MFNKDLLTRCNEPQFKGQYIKPAPLPIMSIRKKNMKLKKLGSIGNKVKRRNTLCIGKVIGMSITNRLQNWGCLMQRKQ